jgi:DedD protein
MASQPTEEGFHEIQLNGKQLVFLFMAATVVSVVIFLCGVLVGRGVRAERAGTQSAALNETPAPDILPSAPVSVPAAIQDGADPRIAPPPGPIDEKSSGITDDIRPDSAKAADSSRAAGGKPESTSGLTKSEKPDKPERSERAAKVEKSTEKAPAPAPKPIPDAKASQPTAPKEPVAAPLPAPAPTPPAATTGDYAVQVAAVNVRTDADAIARRFSSKGYTAYVETPPNGTGTVFRVRIGTFKTKHEAETIAAKLQKEEQIKPWVTR